MELLEGQTLKERIGGKPIAMAALIRVAIGIVDALDAAHSQALCTATSSLPIFSSPASRDWIMQSASRQWDGSWIFNLRENSARRKRDENSLQSRIPSKP